MISKKNYCLGYLSCLYIFVLTRASQCMFYRSWFNFLRYFNCVVFVYHARCFILEIMQVRHSVSQHYGKKSLQNLIKVGISFKNITKRQTFAVYPAGLHMNWQRRSHSPIRRLIFQGGCQFFHSNSRKRVPKMWRYSGAQIGLSLGSLLSALAQTALISMSSTKKTR